MLGKNDLKKVPEADSILQAFFFFLGGNTVKSIFS